MDGVVENLHILSNSSPFYHVILAMEVSSQAPVQSTSKRTASRLEIVIRIISRHSFLILMEEKKDGRVFKCEICGFGRKKRTCSN